MKELVEQIIRQRQEKVPVIQEKERQLCQVLDALDRYDDLKNQIVDGEGNARPGKYQYLAGKNPEVLIKLNALSTNACRAYIDKALAECRKASSRFGRESINISVVGKARIGKSLFLQGISNLNDLVIPAFTETDCTGAVSVIENRPGTELEAHLTFKTEEQMIHTVQTYLDQIIPPEKGRIAIRSLAQIGDPELLKQVEEKMVSGREENILLQYLRDYILQYREWAPLVRQGSLVLYKDQEIQSYIAQNDGAAVGTKYFYKYLAVDSCHIYCTFDYAQAGKITLIDTVGLGNNSLGIKDDMLNVINDRSDAVVFLHLPYSPAGGYVDNEIAKAYGAIEKSCQGRNLNKWLFWLINEAPGHPKTPNDRMRCEACVRTLEGNNWHGAMTKIINVKDQTQVREEFLVPMLNILMSNLDELDSMYTAELAQALDAVQCEFNRFCNAAKKVMTSELNASANIHPQMNQDIGRLHKIRRSKLKELAAAEKAQRDTPCTELYTKVDEIVQQMKDGVLAPSCETVLQQLQYDAPSDIYTRCCNRMRNEVTQSFTNVDVTMDALVEDIKNKITQVLYSDDGCRLGQILAMDPEQKPYEWLAQFAQNVLDPVQYPSLNAAFYNVYRFDFSVRGFLTYEVRACLDKIDPQLIDPPNLIADSERETAQWVSFWLKKNLKNVAEDVEASVGALFRKPHRAFFAIIKEFSDKVDFAEDVQIEWDRLLSENYSVLWPDTFKSMMEASVAFEQWNDTLNSLAACNRNCAALKKI